MSHPFLHARRRIAIACLAVATFYALPAWAGCSISRPYRYPIIRDASLVVGSGVQVGEVVSESVVNGSNQLQLICFPGESRFLSTLTAFAPSDSSVVPLKIDGVDSGFGARFAIKESNESDFQPLPIDRRRTFTVQTNIDGSAQVRYQLVRLPGPIRYGKFETGVLAQSVVTLADNIRFGAYRTISLERLGIARPSCSISSDSLNQAVSLGTHAIGSMPSVGDGSPWRSFRLVTRECDDPQHVIADITFGTGADADQIDGSLFALNAGGARGVGIEIQGPGNTAIVPGQVTSLPAVATGQAFDFRARYQRTTAAVMAGVANGAMTVTVEFR
jgi:type 1 fimbria pilin